MTRYWPLLLLTVVLAGLASYLYVVEFPAEQSKQQAETAETQLVSFTEKDVTGLTLHSPLTDVTLAMKEGKWRITSPIETDADQRVVEGLLRSLVLGKVKRVIDDESGSLAPFGLESPSMVVTVSLDSRQEAIAIGDSGPISSTLYAMRNADKKILLTDLAPKDFLNKTLVSLRKKEVLTFDHAKLERLRLTYPKTEIVLGRSKDKEKSIWAIKFPIEAPADQPEARTLLMKLEELKALGFIDPGPEHETQWKKLTKPDIKITLHMSDSDRVVRLYQPDPATGEAFAVTTPDAPIYRINPGLLKELTKDVFALQDKRLLGVERDEIARLDVKTRDEHYTLIRQHDQWVLEQNPAQPLDQQKVILFVSRVVNLPAELRVVKQAGPLAPYGLASPSAEFTATTKDGQAKGRLVLGSQSGGLVYAMGRGLTGIFQARADLLTQIPSERDLTPQGEGT